MAPARVHRVPHTPFIICKDLEGDYYPCWGATHQSLARNAYAWSNPAALAVELYRLWCKLSEAQKLAFETAASTGACVDLNAGLKEIVVAFLKTNDGGF